MVASHGVIRTAELFQYDDGAWHVVIARGSRKLPRYAMRTNLISRHALGVDVQMTTTITSLSFNLLDVPTRCFGLSCRAAPS